jgi:hypothetical protein
MVDDDTSDDIGPREHALYLLAELEAAFERGGMVWSAQDVARCQQRLARLVMHLAEMRGGANGALSVTDPTSEGIQHPGLSSVIDGSSPKIDR